MIFLEGKHNTILRFIVNVLFRMVNRIVKSNKLTVLQIEELDDMMDESGGSLGDDGDKGEPLCAKRKEET